MCSVTCDFLADATYILVEYSYISLAKRLFPLFCFDLQFRLQMPLFGCGVLLNGSVKFICRLSIMCFIEPKVLQ